MPDPLDLDCRLSSPYVLPGQESRIRLLVKVAAESGAARRPDLNVCLAIDRSFSMQDDHKLERAREAALTFVEALTPTDIFGLVEFGTDVKVTVEARAGIPRDDLRRAIMAIQARSATNLFDAIHAAGAQVMRGIAPSRLNRVILLSDGVPTAGVTSDREILDVVRSARALGISITTIGLGEDYDEVLLSQISEISGGNHYFVDAPADVHVSFARELGRMQAMVGRDLVLSIKMAEGVRLSLENTRYKDRSKMDDGCCEVGLDDMERGGAQPILFTVTLPALDVGRTEIAAVKLSYRQSAGDGQSPAERTERLSAITVEATDDTAAIRTGVDRDVLRQWEELSAVQATAALIENGRSGAVTIPEVVRTLHSTADRLTRVGSPRADFVSRLERTIMEHGEIRSDTAKRTIIERMAAQQGEPPNAGGER